MNFPEGIRIRGGHPSGESVTDTHILSLPCNGSVDLRLKLVIGFEPPIVQTRKRLRQLIRNIGPMMPRHLNTIDEAELPSRQ